MLIGTVTPSNRALANEYPANDATPGSFRNSVAMIGGMFEPVGEEIA